MCFSIDDGDKAFEEESCCCNQDALSTSNGLTRVEGQNGGKGKTHMHPLLISKGESFLKFGCLAEAT